MKTLKSIYQNNLGSCYQVINDKDLSIDCLALEINQISFLIDDSELKTFIKSTETILNHHSQCTCPKDLENKMVIYKNQQTEIRMLLSYHQLIQLKDLLKGADFKLSMNDLLKKYKIF